VGRPREVVLRNARAKRDDIAARRNSPAIIIGADTIVVLNDRILGKPADHDEARSMLSQLSGRTHAVLTGVAVVNTATRREAKDVELTNVTFRTLSGEEIERFIEAVNPVDRAGAYTVDGPGSLLIERYDGCYQNVLGLPIVRLDTLFRTIGDDLFSRTDPQNARFL
jgi:septum formation protein